MIKRIATYGIRPATATREAGLKLRAEGYSYDFIGRLWGVSRTRAWQVINPKPTAKDQPLASGHQALQTPTPTP